MRGFLAPCVAVVALLGACKAPSKGGGSVDQARDASADGADAGSTDSRAAPDSVGARDTASAPADLPAGPPPPATPCASPKMAIPTPGECQGNVAVTCDPETSTLTAAACGQDEECITYLVEEHPSNGSVGRKFTWAACVPKNAKPCGWSWSVPRWVADDPAACVGNVRTRCSMPPIPTYFLPFAPRPGTKTGYLLEQPCESDEFCTAGNTIGTLRCLKEDTPLCTKPAGVWCEGDEIVTCDTYEFRKSCAAVGQTCYPGCSWQTPFCGAPGAKACNGPPPPSCDSAKAYTACNRCLLEVVDCSTCKALDGGMLKDVPCQCALVHARGAPSAWPKCVDAKLTLCDPSVQTDSCAGTVAHQCIGYWKEIDCAAFGQICGVADGVAGCRDANAPICSPGPTGGARCDGNVLVACCPASGRYSATVSCVPGYEVRVDCDLVKPTGFYGCTDYDGHAECN